MTKHADSNSLGIATETASQDADAFRLAIEQREAAILSPNAVLSYPALRQHAEPDSPLRTPFQRDRDRIVHSKAFRRLKHKTQVFIAPEGDHFRTRITHTLETCGVARTVARALGLNEDLTEAIGLGHDLGHPPFGHVGESVLDECLKRHFGRAFKHNEHSLRVVEVLERDGAGLNLTEQVRDGILNHTGPVKPVTLEGRIVRIVDRIAYINHDIDDAVRAGVLAATDLPAREIELLGQSPSERIDTLVRDLVGCSQRAGDIVQSEELGSAMLRLRKFMFDQVYLGPQVRSQTERVAGLVRGLFEYYLQNPDEVPSDAFGPSQADDDLAQHITDWIAGMTDRFAIRVYSQLAIPDEAPNSAS
ncbi:MAG: deoxyguanosinetriphosphate triphosphohydrolase [Thermoleophilaceae bacterium]|nr:deoxyguanosinetriphosphate triphosphohydrolase [Thermoleophilaceae bacterium]